MEGSRLQGGLGDLPASPRHDHLQALLQQVTQEKAALQAQLEQAQVVPCCSCLAALHLSSTERLQSGLYSQTALFDHRTPSSGLWAQEQMIGQV